MIIKKADSRQNKIIENGNGYKSPYLLQVGLSIGSRYFDYYFSDFCK